MSLTITAAVPSPDALGLSPDKGTESTIVGVRGSEGSNRSISSNIITFAPNPEANAANDSGGLASTGGSAHPKDMFDTTNSIVHQITPAGPPANTAPPTRTLEENISMYKWAYGPDQVAPGVSIPYPPHPVWNDLPTEEKKDPTQIFDLGILLGLSQLLKGPEQLTNPDQLYFRIPQEKEGDWTLRELAGANRKYYEAYKTLQATGLNDNLNPLFKNNIADRDDWYTDATFAQQQFTGPNPTTITIASGGWIHRFKEAAALQNRDDVSKLLEQDAGSFYVQDNSYFRAAMRLNADVELKSTSTQPSDPVRYGCASVSLFRLESDGILHPVAIVIDYRGDMPSSVTIFNRRLHSSDSTAQEESDWPWRYAKMCAQSSDWFRHEVTIHLTNAHLVEEAIIVAGHRTLSPDHPVFQLMKDHWSTTIGVNNAARTTLIPGIIIPLAGVGAPQLVQFLNHAYESFDWTNLYVPNDLERRGFPMRSLEYDPKFRDYAYGRNMAMMWPVLRKFVAFHINKAYEGHDSKVAADPELSNFCAEMRGAARLAAFPEVKTIDSLIDMVTMCIHIAAPQHTAINYLQHYYQVFIPNKPPALYQPLPKTLDDLLKVNERFIINSLPGTAHMRDWQIAAMLPFILSKEIVGDQSFMQYAKNVESGVIPGMEEAGRLLRIDLEYLQQKFKEHSHHLEERHPNTRYTVMDPDMTASSIVL